MRLIRELLARYESLTRPDESVRRCAVQVLERICKLTVSENAVALKRNVLHLKVSPPMRSTIFMHKPKLLAALREHCGVHIEDVR